MFSKYILCLLYNFNLWGFCTELTELRMNQAWTRLIFGAQIISSCLLCAFACITLNQNHHKGADFLSISNDVFKISGVVISCWLVLIESYFKRSIQRKFWKIFRQIRDSSNRSDHQLTFGNYFIKFGLFLIVVAGIEIYMFNELASVISGWILFFAFSYFSLLIMQDLRIFHYLFFVHLLDHQLHGVELEMKLMADDSQSAIISRERFKWIRIYYDLIYELSNCMNEVFGWSNIATILCLFLRLVVDLNWIYWLIHNKVDVEVHRTSRLFIYLIWIVLKVMPLQCHCRYAVAISHDFADYLSFPLNHRMCSQGLSYCFGI